MPVVGAIIGGGLDLGIQLLQNGGNIDCVNWKSVGISAGIGALTASTGPGGVLFGRSAKAAGKYGSFPPRPGVFNTGNKRFGWGFNKKSGKQTFGPHGGKPGKPDHWHKVLDGFPIGDLNETFAFGGGVLGGITGNMTLGMDDKKCGC